jgi:hypothetical protein
MTAIALRRSTARSRWLTTLADLALLLVGFLAMLHVVDQRGPAERSRLANGLRAQFGGVVLAPVTVDANRIDGFQPGAAATVQDIAPLLDWVRIAARDPRSRLVITGYGDPRESAEALALAARRAEAVAVTLRASGVVSGNRIDVEARTAAGKGRVDLGIRYQP